MESKNKMYTDNEYFIMNEIMEDENITQMKILVDAGDQYLVIRSNETSE